MGWNPFKDLGNVVSGVGHLAGDIFHGVEHLGKTALKHPLETAATVAAVYYGMPYLGGGEGVPGESFTGPGVTGDTSLLDAGGNALGGMGGLDGLTGFLGDSGNGGFPGFGGLGQTQSSLELGGGPGAGTGGGIEDYLRRAGKGISSWAGSRTPMQLMRMGGGALGLYRANQLQKMARMPDPGSMKDMPGYQAGLDAVQASMASQGYTGGSNAAAAIGKYGADFYNQNVNQRLMMGGAMQGAGVQQLGSLALLMGGF